MNSKLPSITIITVTLNPETKIISQMLAAIDFQNYPKNKIEHLIIDGGSDENFIRFLRKYSCRIIIRKNLNALARIMYGIRVAKGDLIFLLESDNILISKNSLNLLVKPFIDHPEIISTFTTHFAYVKKDSLLDRYCALIGASDPVALYLNKSDRETWINKYYTKGKILEHGRDYDVVEFNENNLPTVGDNGFLTRRNILLRAKNTQKSYVHIDIYVDLLRLGYNRFASVHGVSIRHIIGKSSLALVRRRVLYFSWYSDSNYKKVRRYETFNKNSSKDLRALILFIIFTLTIIQPVIFSVKGYLSKKDLAWFVHPFICYLFLLYYGKSVLTRLKEK